ncbi:MAG TPA: SDR family oxidoreductase [Actinomycetota bacterium]|nr:SDR family oxidoreductase [Actinomycetota bacterium]
MSGFLDGRRALVTGGTSGIGASLVDRLTADGARVVFTGRDAGRGKEVADRSGATFVAADAASEEAVDRSVDLAAEELGGLDALVCVAGVIVDGTITQTSPGDWQALLDVNLTAPYLYSRRCLPLLRESGGGSIVHVSSDAGVWGEEEIGAYSVTKAALVTLAQMLAVEAGPSGIRVNAVCPGDILPGMLTTVSGRERPGDTSDWRVPPMGRIGEAADVAGVVSFLLGPDSVFVTGTALLVDGGMRASYRAWEANA